MTEEHSAEAVLAKTAAVRQHYNPKMLLARFEVDGIVPVYEIETERTFQATVNNIALESHMYDVKMAGDILSAEGWLAELEGHTVPILERIVSNPDAVLGLSANDENILARFICALHFRVPAMRELDSKLREQLLSKVKEAGRHWLDSQLGPAKAEEIWRVWRDKPDEWFLNEEEPYQPAVTTAFFLGEVQEYAVRLRAMPWRIGLAHPHLTVYSSDNPVARHPVPTVRWAGFAFHVYFVPLSPRVVLKIGPGFSQKGTVERIRADYSVWETSLIRHVVSRSADRHLYGTGSYVSRECALGCLKRIDAAKIAYAVILQGFDPSVLR